VSALSNEKTSLYELFNAGVYIRSLCTNTKVTIPDYIEVEFQPGWKSIVENLINAIKNYPISIIQVTEAYSQLDISFEVIGKTKELLVWRAIEEARRKSRSTCACCGNLKNDWKRKGSVRLVCEFCGKNAAKNGKTGTWLDNY
jgi:hypothetical protein